MGYHFNTRGLMIPARDFIDKIQAYLTDRPYETVWYAPIALLLGKAEESIRKHIQRARQHDRIQLAHAEDWCDALGLVAALTIDDYYEWCRIEGEWREGKRIRAAAMERFRKANGNYSHLKATV